MSKTATSAHRVPPYKRPIIIGGFVVILAIVGVITFLLFRAFNKPTEDNASPDDSSVLNSSAEGDSNTSSEAEPEPENKAPQYEGEDPNQLDELTGVITYADIDSETQILYTAVMINQYLQENGQCVLNLRRGDVIYKTVSATAEPEVTTSVCGPFRVSIADVPPGTYQIEILMTGDGKSGTITQDKEI